MATSHPHDHRGTDRTQNHRPSKEDAVADITFERLLRATGDLDDYYQLQTEFILLVCGRLGLRRGELAHMTEEWINWRQRRIEIPMHHPCRDGRDGGECADCKQNAEQQVDHADGDLSYEQALAARWMPKTEAAARSVPFAPLPRVEAVITEFFHRFDEYPQSAQSVNRRVKTIADVADDVEVENIYPHALRATAATYHAGRGVDVFALQQLFGWADLQTARKYISSNPDNTERALYFAHSG